VAPRKPKTAERLTFVEPELSAENEVRFQYGIDLFNTGHYWDAHESWEEIWQELGDEPEDDWEILLRGLIQIAAGLHCLFLKKERGSRGNLKKGWSKIALREDHFLGLDLDHRPLVPVLGLIGVVVEATGHDHPGTLAEGLGDILGKAPPAGDIEEHRLAGELDNAKAVIARQIGKAQRDWLP
jgi:hypothetical protein